MQERIRKTGDPFIHPFAKSLIKDDNEPWKGKYWDKSQIDLVNSIRRRLFEWRQKNYDGISDTSRRLLEFWFDEEHISNDKPFRFYWSQREAIESVIYCYEIAKTKSVRDLYHTFLDDRYWEKLPPELKEKYSQSLFTTFSLKMATGSGKTKVMAMVIVWAYFNYYKENDTNLSPNFLMIAPNTIVLERLITDFQGETIFFKEPFIPNEWKNEFGLEIKISRSGEEDTSKPSSDGVFYLTNIQHIYESRSIDDVNINDVYSEVLNSIKKEDYDSGNYEKTKKDVVYNRIIELDSFIVLNDEAHHLWDDENVWNQTIESIDRYIKANEKGKGVVMMFNITATPKDDKGRFFPNVITDYPLGDAVIDKVVKHPHYLYLRKSKQMGFVLGDEEYQKLLFEENDEEVKTKQEHLSIEKQYTKFKNAYLKFQPWIEFGIYEFEKQKKEWKERAADKKLILFIMANETKDADIIGEEIEKNYPDYKGKVIVIHTDKDGNITYKKKTKKEQESISVAWIETEEDMRTIVKNIDSSDYPFEIVVSVMMLKEGWDVNNVSTVIGLRSYTAKSNILPEQAIGRGLRKILGAGSTEELLLIGSPKFRDIIDGLVDEGINPDEDVHNDSEIITISVDANKKQHNIYIPRTTRRFTQTGIDIFKLSFDDPDLPKRLFEAKKNENFGSFKYEKVDIINHKITDRGVWDFKTPTFQMYVSKMADTILTSIKQTQLMTPFLGFLKNYIKKYFFKTEVDPENDNEVMILLNWQDCREKLYEIMIGYLGSKMVEKSEPTYHKEDINCYDAIGTFPFVISGMKTYYNNPKKCILNKVPCDSGFEQVFCEWLENASDVKSYIKNALKLDFTLTYLDSENRIHLYIPDFIVNCENDEYYIIETKGYEYDPETERRKEETARYWCKIVSEEVQKIWIYLKVYQIELELATIKTLRELVQLYQSKEQ